MLSLSVEEQRYGYKQIIYSEINSTVAGGSLCPLVCNGLEMRRKAQKKWSTCDMMNAWMVKRTKNWLYSNLRDITGKDVGDIFFK